MDPKVTNSGGAPASSHAARSASSGMASPIAARTDGGTSRYPVKIRSVPSHSRAISGTTTGSHNCSCGTRRSASRRGTVRSVRGNPTDLRKRCSHTLLNRKSTHARTTHDQRRARPGRCRVSGSIHPIVLFSDTGA
ncbi:hypothetical protein MTQ16_07360 [Corynebacterium bovis]|uniref:hypothetical protein n=1 Tax=Corynebacterium bovis TaxID=36808 RepID=UPI003138F6E9